jgi:hypothetical protein
VLAALLGVSYAVYVMRVGGDFMFARLLVPTAPFFALLLELALQRAPWRPAVRLAAAAVAVAAMAWTPSVMDHGAFVKGIVDERAYFQTIDRERYRRAGEAMGRAFQGLPVRVAFGGTQCILAYQADPPVAIEAEAGLTDAFVAHQPIARRGRPGHEKSGPMSYLIDRRRAHLFLSSGPDLADSLAPLVPRVPLTFGDWETLVLTWDPEVIPALIARGARGPDFLATLDAYIAAMPGLPDSTVRRDHARFHRFYFAVASDSAREAPFLARVERPHAVPRRVAIAP